MATTDAAPCECIMARDVGEALACKADGPGEAICTRPAGHDGPHTSCTPNEHPDRVWEDR